MGILLGAKRIYLKMLLNSLAKEERKAFRDWIMRSFPSNRLDDSIDLLPPRELAFFIATVRDHIAEKARYHE